MTKTMSKTSQSLSEVFCLYPKVHMLGLVPGWFFQVDPIEVGTLWKILLPLVLRPTEPPKITKSWSPCTHFP